VVLIIDTTDEELRSVGMIEKVRPLSLSVAAPARDPESDLDINRIDICIDHQNLLQYTEYCERGAAESLTQHWEPELGSKV
jgi:hypothetical protein